MIYGAWFICTALKYRGNILAR